MPPSWRMCVAAAQRAQGFVPPDKRQMITRITVNHKFTPFSWSTWRQLEVEPYAVELTPPSPKSGPHLGRDGRGGLSGHRNHAKAPVALSESANISS